MAEAALALSFTPLERGLRLDALDCDALESRHQAVAASARTSRQREFVRCGPILPEHAVEVRDEQGQVLPEGGVGLIFVSGPSLMKAYFNEPEATARTISDNGRNIRPQDLEWSAEGEVDGLRSGDVAAFAVDDAEGESVVVLVESRLADPAAREALCNAVAGVLRTRHGVETRVVIVPPRSLPQTSSGKLSRAKAKALFLSAQFEAGSNVVAESASAG
jgi:fatty-acyl-CoA synthase